MAAVVLLAAVVLIVGALAADRHAGDGSAPVTLDSHGPTIVLDKDFEPPAAPASSTAASPKVIASSWSMAPVDGHFEGEPKLVSSATASQPLVLTSSVTEGPSPLSVPVDAGLVIGAAVVHVAYA